MVMMVKRERRFRNGWSRENRGNPGHQGSLMTQALRPLSSGAAPGLDSALGHFRQALEKRIQTCLVNECLPFVWFSLLL